jgi:hypothetical protein
VDSFVDELPKAELHLHLVGSVSVPTVLELARRHPAGNGMVPRTEPELRAFFELRDFPHFADVYGAVSALVREPADWHRAGPARAPGRVPRGVRGGHRGRAAQRAARGRDVGSADHLGGRERASFLDAAAKQALIDEIDQVAAGHA